MSISATIFGCAGLRLSAQERAFFADVAPWGFILFARNIRDAAQVQALCAELRTAAGHDAPIFIDQEGGRVARLCPPLAREWASPLSFLGEKPHPKRVRGMYLRYRLIGAELRALGLDGNCAPMVDILTRDTHPIIANRTYSARASEIAPLGRAVADGLRDAGVLPVLKHIPGHGRANVDSHLSLPVVHAPRADLQTDFAPFRALTDLPLAMTAHVLFHALDPQNCATLSPDVIRLIREDIGFDGALMTDDLSMQALRGDVGQRARLALAAGCDLILHCNGDMAEMTAIASEAQSLSGKAKIRANAAIAARMAPKEDDIAALSAELAALGGPR